MTCEQFERAIALHIYGELDGAEAHELQHHLAVCANCAAQMQAMQRTRAVLDARPAAPVSPALLASYRSRLEASLDEESAPARGWMDLIHGWFGPSHQGFRYALGPGLVAALVFIGFLSGWLSHSRVAGRESAPREQVAGNIPEQQQTSRLLRVNSISPTANGLVSVTYDDVHQQSVEGPAMDPHIERLLLYAAQNPPNAGVRLDSIDALRAHANDTTVRQTMLWVLAHDPNPGVRLKALDALRAGVADDANVRAGVLHTIMSDTNPGVRAEAIEVLSQAPPDDAARLLEQVAHDTSNVYVRLRCAAQLKQLNAPLPHGVMAPVAPTEAR
jgi:anti-sigma factor RsiW